MTDDEWLTCGTPTRMRGQLRCRPFPALCWLWFDLACVRRVADLLTDPRCHAFIQALTRHAGDPARQPFRSFDRERAAAAQAVYGGRPRADDSLRPARQAAARAVMSLGSGSLATSEMVCVAAGRCARGAGLHAAVRDERRVHAGLMRCTFRSTLAAVVFRPEWRTSAVVSLAAAMRETADFGPMPILADALQEAGCEHEAVLAHCRAADPHARGCWVVGDVLGKG